MSGLITCTWSAGVIHGFTSDERIRAVFDSAPEAMFSNVQQKQGVVRYTNKENHKNVCNYPSLVTWLHDRTKESSVQVVNKIFLFAKAMADRGVSVKREDHEWPLTDLVLEMTLAHGEITVQAAGRLNGLDLCTTPKKLWATKDMHERHQKCIRNIEVIVDRLRNGDFSTSMDDFEKNLEAVEAAEEGTHVEDGFGSYSNLGAGGHTRLEVERAHKRSFQKVKAAAKRRKITFRNTSAGLPTVEPAVEPLPVVQPAVEPVVQPAVEPAVRPAVQPLPVVQPAVEPAVEPVVQPAVEPVVEPAVEPVVEPAVEPAVQPMREVEPDPSVQLFVENHEKKLTSVIREVVKNYPEGVEVAKAAREASMHEGYPDMDNHNPLDVMRCIVAKHDLTILATANVIEMKGMLRKWMV